MPKHETFVRERPYEEIEIGESYSITKCITEADIINYAGIVGDFNPIHIDPNYAKNTMFGKRIAHGMLTASLISTLVGCGIPGKNALYLSQEIKFIKPVFIGDVLTAKAEVVEKNDEKRRVILNTIIKNHKKEVVVSGKAITMVMKQSGE